MARNIDEELVIVQLCLKVKEVQVEGPAAAWRMEFPHTSEVIGIASRRVSAGARLDSPTVACHLHHHV